MNPFNILQPAATSAGVRDPVCGMTVVPENSAASVQYQGETYYFCCAGCATKFKTDPERYLHPQPPAPKEVAAQQNVEYTCPMDPEVRQLGPGTCPKCGMALEPVYFAPTEEANPELRDMTRRFWIAVVLTVP